MRSPIDLVAMRADLTPFNLPNGTQIGPRVIVEANAEHDWDITGREFGAALRHDLGMMADQNARSPSVPAVSRS